MHPQHLGATVLGALAERTGINTADVDDIIWGTSTQTGKQGRDLGRMAALDAGYDVRASGVTIDRFCGSGITSVNLAAATIMAGMSDLSIAGGTEMMSYTAASADPKSPPFIDAGNLRLRRVIRRAIRASARTPSRRWKASHGKTSMRSRLKARSAPTGPSRKAASRKASSPFTRPTASLALEREEFPRPQTTKEGLAGLKPAFEVMAEVPLNEQGETYGGLIRQIYPDLKIRHVHHAGNSSGVVDGAAALLLLRPTTQRGMA